MTKDKKDFDLFGEINTQTNDLWGSVNSDDPFGNTKNEDPFAMFPKDEPKKNNDPFAALPVEPKKEEKKATVVPIKPGADNVSPKVEEKKDEKKTESKPKEKAKTPPKKTSVSDTKVDMNWIIAYASHQKSPEREMTLDEMRETMEIDWPELSKSRTQWEVDAERKLAVAIISGAKMG